MRGLEESAAYPTGGDILKKVIIGAVAVVAAAVLGFGSLTAPTTHANPAKIWVFNGNVAASLAATTPAAINTALVTDDTTRAPYLSKFDTWQAASAGQVSQTGIGGVAGTTYIVVQTDGSNTAVALNGRGLTCAEEDPTPAAAVCGTTPVTDVPNAVDHIIVYSVTDVGTHNINDTLVVTATQDAVTLDSESLTIVGQAHDFQVAAVGAKTTIQEGLSACAVTDSITNPARAGIVDTYTDIQGNALVGYNAATWSSSSSNMLVALAGPLNSSMLLSDGATIAAYNVICGQTAGSATLTSTSGTTEVLGTGAVPRTLAVTITGVPANIALTADPAAIACDGSATSTVTAKVTDSAGNDVVDNTGVTFSVVALGTANPIQTTTTGGSASSTITPLSGGIAGTTVVVQSGDVQASIRIDCLQPTPTVPAGPVPTSTPTGGIVGPNTGTGGYLGQDSTGSFSMWTLIALAMGSVALVAGGMVTRRAGK
jgi:adhesin/invasin